MDPAAARLIRNRAIAYRNQDTLNGGNTPIIIPRGKIKDPKKWVITKPNQITICPNGSLVSFRRGDEVEQTHLYNALTDAGATLVPIG